MKKIIVNVVYVLMIIGYKIMNRIVVILLKFILKKLKVVEKFKVKIFVLRK